MTTTPTSARPQVHFAPRRGWINDPHGLTYHDGLYHLFYQALPDSLAWEQPIQWGHAVSADLIHWTERSPILLPGDGDAGCWTGCLVVDADGAARIFYSAADKERLETCKIRIATPTDATWDEWVKGPVVVRTPDEDAAAFRDPVVFRDGERWVMLVGYGSADGTAGVKVFVSPDLVTWEYDGTLAERRSILSDPWTGSGWECPQLVRVPRGDVLLVGAWDNHTTLEVYGATGTYEGCRFESDSWHQLSFGGGHYAPSAFVDRAGDPGVVFWIRGVGEAGVWSGAISVAYAPFVDETGRLRLQPHPSVADARVPADEPGEGAVDAEWTPNEGESLKLVDSSGLVIAALSYDRGIVTCAVPDRDLLVLPHSAGTVRLIADARVVEIVSDAGLAGVPLPDITGALYPHASRAGSLAWWRLA